MTLDGTEDRALLRGLSGEALMAAALACKDAADFRRRVGERHGPDAPKDAADFRRRVGERHGPDAPRGDGTHGDAP